MGAERGRVKSPVQPFRPELERLMDEARTALAAERFEIVRIKGELAIAARAGHSSCLLQGDGAIDLRQAPATLKLLRWCEREGLRTEWLRRAVGDADGDAAWDLLVSWRQRAAPA